MIQPTSPMRKTKHINQCLNKLIIGKFDSVITISETNLKYHPYKQFITNKENLIWFDKSIGDKIVIRQDLSPTYHKNGACYAIDSSFLLNSNKEATPIGENSSYIITEDMISIDEINDFKIIEEKIKQTHLDINEYIND